MRETIDVVPAGRLGARLRAYRRVSGLSRRESARRAGVPHRVLAAWERGRVMPSYDDLVALSAVYEIDSEHVMPERRAGSVRVSAASVEVSGVERPLGAELDPEEVLAKYLDAVYELRGIRPGGDVALRDADLADLADALGDTPEEIENRLVELIACTRAEARALRRALVKRRFVVPAAGVALGLGGLSPALAQVDFGAGDTKPVSSVEQLDDAGDAVDEIVEAPVEAPVEVPAPTPPVEQPVQEQIEEPANHDWAELIDPLVVEPGDDWAELIEPLVVEPDPADSGEAEPTP